MHAGFVFGRLDFREVRMQQRGLAGIRVQVKERSVKIRQEQRYDSVPGQDSSHAGILTNDRRQVNRACHAKA
jgi:hypothetical protein